MILLFTSEKLSWEKKTKLVYNFTICFRKFLQSSWRWQFTHLGKFLLIKQLFVYQGLFQDLGVAVPTNSKLLYKLALLNPSWFPNLKDLPKPL